MTAINLSSLLKVSVSTYEGGSLSSDSVYESMKQDLDDCGIKDFFDKNDVDEWLDFEGLKKDIASYFQDELEKDILEVHWITMKDFWAKYDIDYEWFHFYTPKEYNFESDSLDIKLQLKIDDEEWKKKWMPELKEYIQRYIDDIRVDSYDWYMSFEPNKAEDCEWDDYAVIWAILRKEWKSSYWNWQSVYQTLEKCMNECVLEWIDSLYWENSNPVYLIRINDDDWKFVKWAKCKLDMDNKAFIPIEKDEKKSV